MKNVLITLNLIIGLLFMTGFKTIEEEMQETYGNFKGFNPLVDYFSEPEFTVDSFIRFTFSGDFAAAYFCHAEPFLKNVPIEKYRYELFPNQTPSLRDNTPKYSLKIKEVKKNGRTATVKTEQNLTDWEKIGPVVQELTEKYPGNTYEDATKRTQELMQRFNNDFPTVVKTVEYTLLKEKEGWKILPEGYDAPK